jgi:integrase
LPRRNRYQFGNLELQKRIKGPDVWIFRYRDRENPTVTRPAITLGTVEDFPSRADARHAAEGLRLQINNGLPLREAVTFRGLIDRYVSEEIELGDLAHTTKEPELNRVNKHISPKWGKCLLKDVKPYLTRLRLRPTSHATL